MKDEFIASRTVLVDNSIISFIPQSSNGIHITPYYGEYQDDDMLYHVARFIKTDVNNENDVRPLLERKFNVPNNVSKLLEK